MSAVARRIVRGTFGRRIPDRPKQELPERTTVERGLSPMNLPIAHDFAPMEAQSADALPVGDGWQYEPKWDGFRCLAFRDGGKVELRSKSGQTLGRYFPDVVAALVGGRAGALRAGWRDPDPRGRRSVLRGVAAAPASRVEPGADAGRHASGDVHGVRPAGHAGWPRSDLADAAAEARPPGTGVPVTRGRVRAALPCQLRSERGGGVA